MRQAKLFLAAGAALLLAAISLAAWQLWQDRQIAGCTQALLQQTQQMKPEADAPAAAPPAVPEQAEPSPAAVDVQEQGAESADGTLEIPALDLLLPVLGSCSEELLELSPCRYAGAAGTDDLVVAGHNYAAHFGALHRLQTGDAVCFTDQNGTQHRYCVTAIAVLPPDAVAEMTQSDAALTLFTCTAGGKKRLTVRCERTE